MQILADVLLFLFPLKPPNIKHKAVISSCGHLLSSRHSETIVYIWDPYVIGERYWFTVFLFLRRTTTIFTENFRLYSKRKPIQILYVFPPYQHRINVNYDRRKLCYKVCVTFENSTLFYACIVIIGINLGFMSLRSCGVSSMLLQGSRYWCCIYVNLCRR